MSGYIIEEPNEKPVKYNSIGQVIQEITIIDYYNYDYSKIQRKRFRSVLSQLREIWTVVYETMSFLRNQNGFNIDESNFFMNNIYKMFFMELKVKIDFYNQEKINKRKERNYLSKKINKIRNSKSKL